MAHLSSPALWSEIEDQGSAAYAAGVRFFVVVENAKGEWFALHADDQDHAARLARHWVDVIGCRGASCWRLFAWGHHGDEAFFSYFESEPEDHDPLGEAIEGQLIQRRVA
jgi:hypothetical protein